MTNFEKFKEQILDIKKNYGKDDASEYDDKSFAKFNSELTQFAIEHGLKFDFCEEGQRQIIIWFMSEYDEKNDVDRTDDVKKSREYKIFGLAHLLRLLED